MYFTIILIFCVFRVTFANGESCVSPNKLNGTCKAINECDVLRKIVVKPNRSSQDEHFLRQSKCGFEGSLPKVCCPDTDKFPCRTPEGKAGECVNIQSCPHLLEMAKNPNNTENVTYVRNTLCVGPENYSVCCGPPPRSEDKHISWTRCEATVSAFPPDPKSGCCGIDATVGDKILGGNGTFIDQYPWVVLIEYVKLLEKVKLLCGGALISGKYVLTAAHCVTGPILRKGTPKNVRLGEFNVTNEGPDCGGPVDGDCTDGMILAPIEEITPHPQYNAIDIERPNDIALIRIKIFAPYTDFIRPICLPTSDTVQSPPKYFFLYVAGWGRYIQNITTYANIFRSSDVKRHVQLPYASRDKCQTALRTLSGAERINIGDGHICAGGELGEGTCKGDSGSPLMYVHAPTRTYEAIGILSTGATKCAQEGIPSVFTYVFKYLPWIRENIKP